MMYKSWMANKITKLREAGGMSVEQLAALVGTSASQIYKLEKGERRLTDIWLTRLSVALQCEPYDLFTTIKKMIPVVGIVGAGSNVYPIDDMPLINAGGSLAVKDTDPMEYVESPPDTDPKGLVALRVEGDSQKPFLPSGSFVYYRGTTIGLVEKCLGRLSVVKLKDGAVQVKVLSKGTAPGLYHLTSFNAPMTEDVEIEWCAKVENIKIA